AGHINDDARLESDFQAASVPGRLRYVPMAVVAKGRGTQELLAGRNSEDEELGALDGLLAEGDLGAVRYGVVDAGGVLVHRRYLLPIALVGYDRSASVLRVDIDRQVAERYPAFDSDEFEQLSDADRSGYERRLLKFFPRDIAATGLGDDPIGALPEWLLKGTWITVPPTRAERLPHQARSFVNEFSPTPAENDDRARDQMVAFDRPPA